MGDTPQGYYEEIYEQLRRRVGKATWEKLVFGFIYYQSVLQRQQEEIFIRTKPLIDWMKLRKFLLYGFSDAASLEHKKSDPKSAYHLTQKVIQEELDRVFFKAGEKAVPVVIIAQSLGCQVISNYIWDATPGKPSPPPHGIWAQPGGNKSGSEKDIFRRLRTLARLYTTGCNIPIFVAGHERIVAIDKPNEGFRWHNFYDEDDVLGWPLKPLSPSYEKLVEDIEVNAGGGVLGAIMNSWTPFSHGEYWEDGEVLKHLVGTIEELA